MTVHDSRDALGTAATPRPRESEEDTVQQQTTTRTTAPTGLLPWPEPWHHTRGTRPRSEYWDTTTASWHSRGPIPAPRQGD